MYMLDNVDGTTYSRVMINAAVQKDWTSETVFKNVQLKSDAPGTY